MKDRLYIAYGSNLSVEQMAGRCPTAEIAGVAILEDWKLVFKGCATIEREKDSRVPVLVWRIRPQDERNLDRYEGYPKFYYKEDLDIEMRHPDGTVSGEKAMAYIMTDIRKPGPPMDHYYGIIDEGYQRFGFDRKILKKALAESRKAERRKRDEDTGQRIC